MRDQGLGSWTARRARMTPHRPAVVFGDQRWSYGDLHHHATRLAHGLRSLGVDRGDRVACAGPNHPSVLQTLFATTMLGAVYVPLNTRLTGPELEHIVVDAGAKVLVHGTGLDDRAAFLADRVPGLSPVAVGDTPVAGGITLAALVDSAPTDPIDEEVGLDDLAMIMYTSGTTGRPKGAMLSHGNLTWNTMNVLIDVDLGGDEVTLVTAPMFHAAALNMSCLPTLVKGGCAVLVEAFDPDTVFDLIAEHRVTWMFGVPAMYQTMAQHPRWADADLSSLRTLECGGAPVPESLITTYQQRGLTFLQGYGMTEASPGVLFLGEHMLPKVGTAGVASFFTDVRLVDGVGNPVPPGEVGEIQVQGPNVMVGYWRRPDATAEAIDADGWFRSGDAAVIDEDGYFTIHDRIKDMYISGGENVYPAEVEAAVLEHPAVSDCGVIGVPDDRWGEVGLAIVVTKEGQTLTLEELVEFLEGRLARFKLPKHLELVDELPRTGPGKIAKPALRDRFATRSATPSDTQEGTATT
ncbi:MAG: acyl-CoA synthetase [Acidimicrobiales bacterium]